MDQRRRLMLFMTLGLGFMILWSKFVVPKIVPPAPAVAKKDADADKGGGDKAGAEAAGAEAGDAADGKSEPQKLVGGDADSSTDDPQKSADGDSVAAGDQNSTNAEQTDQPTVPAAEPKLVTLGSRNVESGYFIEVECTSMGAGINGVWLSHPKFKEIDNRQKQMQLLGDSPSPLKTLATRLGTKIAPDSSTAQTWMKTIDWEVIDQGPETVTFQTKMPTGVVVEKTYRIQKHGSKSGEWDSSPPGYQIECELTFKNPTDKDARLTYKTQGPVGVRLENEEHARKFRDVKVGFYKDSGATKLTTSTSSTIYEAYQEQYQVAAAENVLMEPDALMEYLNNNMEVWGQPFKYISVDVQFFAAIVAPLDNRDLEQQMAQPWITSARPVLVDGNSKKPTWSDVSFQFVAEPKTISPGQQVTHKYSFYTGPKRETLVDLEPYKAGAILDHGSIIGPISRGMLWLLRAFHKIGLPWALCIIGLTLMVRGCMYPLSRKQAMGAKKMKELQPKLAELKAKFGEDREKMARAQMELFRKNNYNPLAGCLPVFLQLPIFIGLYTALNVAVDLRLERFLWCDNLAAPDKLFRMPFELPFLGSNFNLLPIITCVLFIVQQKMFMPPPTDEQQALQQKMMSYMTIMFGFMFWHVPAGLCVYFLASSLWGLAERKMLDMKKTAGPILDVDLDDDSGGGKGGGKKGKGGGGGKGGGKSALVTKADAKNGPEKKGFFAKLAEAAEEANRQAQSAKKKSDARKKKR